MRIAFTGTHRVGKTSLMEAVASQLPHYNMQAEPYLQLEEKGYLFSEIPTGEDYLRQFQFAIQLMDSGGSETLFDRSPLDLLAYLYATDKRIDLPALYAQMTEALSLIDLLVFVPIEKPDIIGCPETDLPRLRLRVNHILQDWIADIDIDVLEVTGSLPMRTQQVLKRM